MLIGKLRINVQTRVKSRNVFGIPVELLKKSNNPWKAIEIWTPQLSSNVTLSICTLVLKRNYGPTCLFTPIWPFVFAQTSQIRTALTNWMTRKEFHFCSLYRVWGLRLFLWWQREHTGLRRKARRVWRQNYDVADGGVDSRNKGSSIFGARDNWSTHQPYSTE